MVRSWLALILTILVISNLYQYFRYLSLKKESNIIIKQKLICESSLELQNQQIKQYKKNIENSRRKYEKNLQTIKNDISAKRKQAENNNLENIVSDIIDDFYR